MRGRTNGARVLRSVAILVAVRALAWPDAGRGDRLGEWWAENVEIHGFFTSNLYTRSPGLAGKPQVSSWRNELNLEVGMDLYEGDELRIGAYGVFRPIYDAVYEINDTRWGDRARGPEIGQFVREDFGASTAPDAVDGRAFELRGFPDGSIVPCGASVEREFCLDNADVGSLFSGEPEVALTIDDVVFFGITSAPWLPRGDKQGKIGGNASGNTYRDYLRSPFREPLALQRLSAALPSLPPPFISALVANGTAGLDASLGMSSQPLGQALNFQRGALGDVESLTQAPFDVNRGEDRLKFDCLDNAHPWCFVREFYFELDWRDTLVRLGRQQVVWGKTDAFRLQDVLMPVDLGYHNIFPTLEERRIPMLSLDVIQGLPNLGPFLDASFEFVWIFDRYLPLQFGQCGEPYAYTIACQGRVDAAAHQLFNFALAAVDERKWRIENTEPGVRLEFRIPEPSISFSLSMFYGFQDLPVARFQNHYSVNNPNPAALLFLQGLGVGGAINLLNGLPPFDPNLPWNGFDPYGDPRDPTSGISQANQQLLTAWPLALDRCAADFPGTRPEACGALLASLALPWTASEVVLEYPRVLTLGASADYQIPGIDTILRVELAADIDRKINNTLVFDGVDRSHVFLASVGLDRPTYIPFLNPNRTAFLTFQTFFEHILDYDAGGRVTGMVPYETQIVSTFQMQNFWRNDSLILTNLFAIDWMAQAIIWGPKLRWVLGQSVFFDVGFNLLWGGAKRHHNIRDLCPGEDGGLSCLADPTSWNAGQWQMLNGELDQAAQSPWWARQSFADRFMERRDEFFLGFTFQF